MQVRAGERARSVRAWIVVLLGSLTLPAQAAAAITVPRPADGIAPRPAGLEVDALDARQTAALSNLRGRSRAPVAVSVQHGQPRLVQGAIPVSGDTLAARARDFMTSYGNALWRLGPNSELVLNRTDPGTGMASYSQRYRGLPVIGGGVSVVQGGGSVVAAFGTLMPGDGFDIAPQLTPAQAVAAALGRTGGRLLAPPELAVDHRRPFVAPSRAAQPPEPVRMLVYSVTVARPGGSFVVLVDALSGNVVREVSMQQESAAALDEYEAEWFDANGRPYDEDDECQADVPGVVEVGDDDGLFGDYANFAQYAVNWSNARRGYVFFYDRFGRLSYDGSDGPVIGYQESSETSNAFWSPGCEDMSFAIGYGSQDVPVHELAHGITQFTSSLEYQDEPGALNESFSDVMAAISDPDDGVWLVGEHNVNGGGPIRNMANPKVDRYIEMIDPDPDADGYDHGGVHTNSGVGNKAAFLLAEGGIHVDSETLVTGMGRLKAGKIFYAAYTSLTEYSDYEDMRNASVAIANYWRLVGAHGFTAQNVCTVMNAWRAVGVGEGDIDCDGAPDSVDSDDDGDGVPSGSGSSGDNCPFIPNPSQADQDHDLYGDACDDDDDGDEVVDAKDNCPSKSNPNQLDLNFNGIGDACDDGDGDGVLVNQDNCPDDYNPGQEDSNGDGFYGDACDPDTDGDGVPASGGDNCPNVANGDQADADGDFYGDACDPCPSAADPTPAFGFNGQPLIDDADGDGLPDECDGGFRVPGASWPGAVQPTRVATPLEIDLRTASRIPVPLEVCPPPCADTDAARSFRLQLSGLPAELTAIVTDSRGEAWARSSTLPDGTVDLSFTARGDRSYYLTFKSTGDGPSEPVATVTLERFLVTPPPQPPADAAVALEEPPEQIVPGATLTFRVPVATETLSQAEGTVVQMHWSGPLTVEDPVRDVGTLGAETKVLTFTGQVTGPGAFTATATVSTTSVDPEPANDVATFASAVPLTFGGFQAPIDDPPTVNTGRAGRTYPVKFAVTDAAGATVSSLDAISSIRRKEVSCGAFTGDPVDAIETTATGATELRFEDGRFVYDWKTPAAAGCHELFVTLADGVVHSANFRLR